VGKTKKYFFVGSLTSSMEVMIFWGHAHIEVKKTVHTMCGIWVSEGAVFDADSKNVNLPSSQNAPKKVIPDKRFSYGHRGPHGEIFIRG
jgi:hypothetical protein